MSTFGYTSIGGTNETPSGDYKYACKATLTVAAVVYKLSAYITGIYTDGTRDIRGIIYSDDDGSPDTLLGTTLPKICTYDQTAGWVDFWFATPVRLTAGDYWLGLHLGNSSSGVAVTQCQSNASGSYAYNADEYDDGASSTFGAATTATKQLSLYASYFAASNSIRLLPETTAEVSTLEVANKVYVVVEGSSPLVTGSATNTTDAPTYGDSPREAVEIIKSGDATFCNTVAAAQLAVRKVERYRLNGLPVRLRDGLGIERGQAVLVIIPRAGISAALPVRRLEHDFAANRTLVDVGEFSAPRSDIAALVEVAKRLDQLTKESKI